MGKRRSGATIPELRARLRSADAAFIGPRGGRNTLAGGVILRVDFSRVQRQLSIAFDVASKEIGGRGATNALAEALNHESAIFYTAAKRQLVAQTSVKYGRVSRALKETKAKAGNLTYRLDASDKATPLNDFMRRARPGKRAVVFVWNKQRTLKRGFVIRAGGKLAIVKRKSKGHKAGSLKALWGPIVPKEMIRPGEPTLRLIQRRLPGTVMKRFKHNYERAIAKAKAASGT